MPGLVPGIRAFEGPAKDLDGRNGAGQDEEFSIGSNREHVYSPLPPPARIAACAALAISGGMANASWRICATCSPLIS